MEPLTWAAVSFTLWSPAIGDCFPLEYVNFRALNPCSASPWYSTLLIRTTWFGQDYKSSSVGKFPVQPLFLCPNSMHCVTFGGQNYGNSLINVATMGGFLTGSTRIIAFSFSLTANLNVSPNWNTSTSPSGKTCQVPSYQSFSCVTWPPGFRITCDIWPSSFQSQWPAIASGHLIEFCN